MKTPLQRIQRWIGGRRSARARRLALAGGAVGSALLLALYSRVQAPWFVLGFVALVPWLLALDSRRASWIEAAGAGVAMSVAFVALVFSWFPGAVERYSHMPSPVVWLILLVAAPVLQPQFVVFAVVRALARRTRGRGSAFIAAIAAACAYVGAELLLPKLFFDTLGQGLYPSVYLRQAADLAGVHGLTLFLLLVNEGVSATLKRSVRSLVWQSRAEAEGPDARNAAGKTGETGERSRRSRAARRLVPLVCALGLVLADYAYGYFRYAQVKALSQAPGHVVGVVQANITDYDKLRAEKGAFETVRMILDAHFALSDEIRERAPVDLLVWPETVYPTTFGSPKSEAGAAFDEEITAFVTSRGIPLIFGGYDAEGTREFNAAFFLRAGPDGRIESSSYRKRMLFPFTEWVPGALDSEWLRSLLPWTGRWERGPGPRVIPLKRKDGKSISVVPLICYDAVFPGFIAEAMRTDAADLIVTISNDSWFPDDRAPRLHLISAAFRSIETRLPQVRATTSGISAMITPAGDIVAESRWGRREALAATLPAVGRVVTPAVRWGQWFGPGLLGVALGLLLLGVARGARASV